MDALWLWENKNGIKGGRRKVLTMLGLAQITTRGEKSFLLHEDQNWSSKEKGSLEEEKKSKEGYFDLGFRFTKCL